MQKRAPTYPNLSVIMQKRHTMLLRFCLITGKGGRG